MAENQNYQRRYLSLLEQMIVTRGGAIPATAKISNEDERELQLIETLSGLSSGGASTAITLGASAPASPTNGMLWVEVSADTIPIKGVWVYQNTRWMSANLYHYQVRRAAVSAAFKERLCIINSGVLVEQFQVQFQVASTPAAGNTWRYSLHRRASSGVDTEATFAASAIDTTYQDFLQTTNIFVSSSTARSLVFGLSVAAGSPPELLDLLVQVALRHTRTSS